MTPCLAGLLGTCAVAAAPVGVDPPAERIERYDFAEATVTIADPPAGNPFTDAELTGTLRDPDGRAIAVDGFCDDPAGRVFRLRFMPTTAGRHTWSLSLRWGELAVTQDGAFEAVEAGRRGLVRVDPAHPFHFVWEGTGEHYWYNSTTTYWLLGWRREPMLDAVDRLHRLKVNRLRVALCGRVEDGRAWFENVFPTDDFRMTLSPWACARPDDVARPGVDVTRFDLAYWRHLEALLAFARDRDVQISIIFYVDGRRPGVDPFGGEAGGPAEKRYYRYTAARLAAYCNVMWDVTNEYRLFRNDAWCEVMGAWLRDCDPYDHLTSVHGHGTFNFRQSPWADFAMYQSWDEHGGYRYMLRNRREQQATGRPIPQVNEEYGYEDHYPQGWGQNRVAPARSADSRRRLAWEIAMAGGYQTTGERADQGTGWGPDTGGGWINGRGDETMTMLVGYAHLMDFFAELEWWKLEPVDRDDAMILAEPGRCYVAYLPAGGSVALDLAPGRYSAGWFNPRTGQTTPLPAVDGGAYTSPAAPDTEDWALLLRAE